MDTELITEIHKIDYAARLSAAGFNISNNEYFLFAGEMPTEVNWLLHLSVSLPDIDQVLEQVLPLLKDFKVPFSMPRNADIARSILYGQSGMEIFGKVINIAPKDGPQAAKLAELIKKLTLGAEGPEIPTAAPLGGIVYATYQGAKTFNASMWPFTVKQPSNKKHRKLVFNSKYLVRGTIKPDLKGDVFGGIYWKGFLKLGKCIIKQGRKNMWTDFGKRCMEDRIKWQTKLQLELQGIVNVPKVLDTVNDNGDTYLIMEYIDGEQLQDVVLAIYKNQKWNTLSLEHKSKVLDILILVVDAIHNLHRHGYVHRDITPANFILTANHQLYMIDLEIAYHITSAYPSPPFGFGTNGYMSKEQYKHETPTIKEDVFGLGGLMISLFTGKAPGNFKYEVTEELYDELKNYLPDLSIINLILSCYDHDPVARPELPKVRLILQKVKDKIENVT